MKKIDEKIRKRLKRKNSIRKKIYGTLEKPRITIYKSNKYTSLQCINDEKGMSIAAASNIEKDNRNIKNNVEKIEELGVVLGKRLKEKKVKKAVFDRNGYKYHGIVKAVCQGIRKAGICF